MKFWMFEKKAASILRQPLRTNLIFHDFLNLYYVPIRYYF